MQSTSKDLPKNYWLTQRGMDYHAGIHAIYVRQTLKMHNHIYGKKIPRLRRVKVES